MTLLLVIFLLLEGIFISEQGLFFRTIYLRHDFNIVVNLIDAKVSSTEMNYHIITK